MDNLKALSYELRKNTVDIIRNGGGGHIGGDMSVMEILVALYFSVMNISPENADDPKRDRFVMSKGHSVESLYAVLAKKGFFPLQEVLDTFSKFGSKFIGHPNNKIPG
ncbi:MAG: transketolase, partial [Lachnospiraceae bacterium]|nr:transketolase [Lachnospiraceae bacterium]